VSSCAVLISRSFSHCQYRSIANGRLVPRVWSRALCASEIDSSKIGEKLVFVPVRIYLRFYKSLSCVPSDMIHL
jgi:hypothetical protein